MNANDDINLKSRRDRIDIAISCVSTIFLCTWVAFHPNIPGPDEPKWKVIRRRIGCMIGGILAPEIYVLLAARQFIAARRFAKTYRGLGWTLTHGFFALMGGFMIYDDKTADKIGFHDPLVIDFTRDFISLQGFEHRLAAQDGESSSGSSLTQGFVHILAALEHSRDDFRTYRIALAAVAGHPGPHIDDCIRQVVWYNTQLTNRRMTAILSKNLEYERDRRLLKRILTFSKALAGINEITDYADTTEISDGTKGSASSHVPDPAFENSLVPRINEQDIQDKSKSDMLTKTIALFQVAWFILQLCARYHENLAITELEVLTLAFCILNFATYALWWKKPFAVARGYAIRWKDDGWEVIAPPPPPPPPPTLTFVETCQDLQEQKDVGLQRNEQFRGWWGTIEFDIGGDMGSLGGQTCIDFQSQNDETQGSGGSHLLSLWVSSYLGIWFDPFSGVVFGSYKY
ncbi:hypothetical protein NLI96_g7547 [Meripilus lineatus]|uniref:Uncharacterized protein n=1 Tax=Meripilus lineatus TaxID=2056292 RepID=A0AAD5V3Q7_9APHY|nr:hypothetical protein NLI96_g7547 [Physisporinus lineatus]